MQSQPPVKQVGGTHYQGTYQHWDLMDEFEVSYLEACATKYLERWERKGGVVDLEKAISYIEKRLVNLEYGRMFAIEPLKFEEWLLEARVGKAETEAIRYILFWRDEDDLYKAIDLISGLIGSIPLKNYVDQ